MKYNTNLAFPTIHTNTLLNNEIDNYLQRTRKQLDLLSGKVIFPIAEVINETRKNNRSVFIFGNGGSATTAMHMTNDFSRIYSSSGKPLKVHCLTGNMSTFSALANDFGYENVFKKQLDGILREKDAVIGLSASGNSPNCVSALTFAKDVGATTISLLGFEGGKMKSLSDYYVHISENDYYIAEDLHLTVSHTLTYILKFMAN